ncbi:lysophospholipid acyltransferase family protein [Rubritalea marina]|uniref:lysophospholipid acyltransferase family protein n=1 Tax=Rubritalea marina TaxID=361055 RepID=UPI00035CE71E|nr:lysophospholipid acyltransferase family protein [Rubritalea marina]
MSDHHAIRGGRKQRIIGSAIGWCLRALGSTLRIEIDNQSGVDTDIVDGSEPVLWSFWHNTIFVMPYVRIKAFRPRKVVVLASASPDGQILESAVNVCEIGAVRGSSSRRAVAALIALRKAIESGSDVCITPDGPRGPRYKLQPGIVKVAQATRAPMVPITVECKYAIKLSTWDALRIPLPFSKVKVTLGPKRYASNEMTEEEFEAVRSKLEADMMGA